jgi:hypothetical protein
LAGHHQATGTIARGTVYAGYAPAGNFALTAAGRTVARQPAFGWASQFPGATAGPATLAFQRFPFVPCLVVIELAGWLVLALALAGWRRRSRAAPLVAGSA